VYGIYSAAVGVKRKKQPKARRGPGRAAPERATALLWGARSQSGASKPGLSLQRIVQAAVELADEGGLHAVSMRRLAQRLGFTTMSLYRHVPGREELSDLMRDAVFREVPPAPASAGSWRTALEAWAREAWALHLRHPWLAVMGRSRRVPGPNVVAHYEGALRAVSSAALGPAEIVAVVDLIGGFVESTARRAAETALTERSTGVSEAEWWGARGSLFESLAGYPTLESVWRSGGYENALDAFEFGLGRLLDGIDRFVSSKKGGSRG
jgi:AcrR family transcriptional regulator